MSVAPITAASSRTVYEGSGLTASIDITTFADIAASTQYEFIVTATTTLVITGVSGRHIRICHINMVSAGTQNVGIISGTGSTCGTGTGAIVGTTAGTGYNWTAQTGISVGSGIGTVMRTVAAGDSICFITSAGVQLSGVIAYTIY